MPEKILMVDDEDSRAGGISAHVPQRISNRYRGRRSGGPGRARSDRALCRRGLGHANAGDGWRQLLRKVKLLAPDTVRIMLTGDADIHSAVSAVNEGSIFRFLTKPCNKDTLGKALTAGLMQYRLLTAEKDLLENTLQGSIQVLTEVLSLVNPAAFGRALRVRRYIHHVARAHGSGKPVEI